MCNKAQANLDDPTHGRWRNISQKHGMKVVKVASRHMVTATGVHIIPIEVILS